LEASVESRDFSSVQEMFDYMVISRKKLVFFVIGHGESSHNYCSMYISGEGEIMVDWKVTGIFYKDDISYFYLVLKTGFKTDLSNVLCIPQEHEYVLA